MTFVDVGDEVNDQVDAAYPTKYRRYAAPIIDAITSPRPEPRRSNSCPGDGPSVREPSIPPSSTQHRREALTVNAYGRAPSRS
ncbi:MAG TPA: hypothetical protein VE196_09705 [Pseudonocardiaceae bacterium]|nr:hypothetical protein [Pseudonocardiaceae bacterium]